MLWYHLAISHVHLQIQVDKKGTNGLWKVAGDLQANAHFSQWDQSQANKINKSVTKSPLCTLSPELGTATLQNTLVGSTTSRVRVSVGRG